MLPLLVANYSLYEFNVPSSPCSFLRHTLNHLGLLQAPPMLPLLVTDYSFDKFSDIIVTTRDGYYGFTQARFSSP